MSHESKNNTLTLTAYLNARAQMLASVRQFFDEHQVLEVETPILWPTTLPDPNVPSIEANYQPDPKRQGSCRYLQTSPEFFMKRLLAAGSGSIYQISKAFRNDFSGKLHRPEFSLLEWYRLEFDHFRLMEEVDSFLQAILGALPAEKISYQTLFQKRLGFDPLLASKEHLIEYAKAHGLNFSEIMLEEKKDFWLSLLMSHFLEPTLGQDKPCMIYHYPVSQAALARINPDDPQTACRFEVYYQGIELANGFYELNNAEVQRRRFKTYQEESKRRGLKPYALDEAFLNAVDVLPDCAGVALGLDRLFMLKYQLDALYDPWKS